MTPNDHLALIYIPKRRKRVYLVNLEMSTGKPHLKIESSRSPTQLYLFYFSENLTLTHHLIN